MNFQRFLVPLLVIGLLAMAWHNWGWPGVAAAGGGVLMWLLLHFTRLMTVMKRAAEKPLGWVASAVMLNAKLKPGMSLMHVIGLTRALGEQVSAEGEQPERYRWTDNGQSSVTVRVHQGKVLDWELVRPPEPPESEGASGT